MSDSPLARLDHRGTMLITQENFKTRKEFVKAYYESMLDTMYICKCIDDGSFITPPMFNKPVYNPETGYDTLFDKWFYRGPHNFKILQNKTLTNLGLESANNFYLFDAIMNGPLKYRHTEEEYVIDEVKEKYINHFKHIIWQKICKADERTSKKWITVEEKRYSFGYAIDHILDKLKGNAVFILSDNTLKYKLFLKWKIGCYNGLGNFEFIRDEDNCFFANLLGYKIPCIVPKERLWNISLMWRGGFYDHSDYEPFLVILHKDKPVEEVSYFFTNDKK